MLAGGLLPAIFSSHFLPVSYLADASTIHAIITHTSQLVPDSSFQHTADYYLLLGIGAHPVAVSIANYVLYAIVIFMAIAQVGRMSLTTTGIAAFSALLATVYLAQYSKDAIVLYISLMVLLTRAWKRADIALVAMMLTYAYLFRHYWYLVAALYVMYRWYLPRKKSSLHIVSALTLALFMLVILFHYHLHYPIEHYRTTVNSIRASGSVTVNSLIRTPHFGESVPGQMATAGVSLVFLLIPLPLAALGGIQYAVFALGIGALWVLVLRALRRLLDDDGRTYPVVALRCGIMALSLVTVQCLFEPDYGSYVRHLSPLVPLMLVAIGAARGRARPHKVGGATRSGRLAAHGGIGGSTTGRLNQVKAEDSTVAYSPGSSSDMSWIGNLKEVWDQESAISSNR